MFSLPVGFFWATVETDEVLHDHSLADDEVDYETQNTMSLIYKKVTIECDSSQYHYILIVQIITCKLKDGKFDKTYLWLFTIKFLLSQHLSFPKVRYYFSQAFSLINP